jgi:tellurite resistance protein TerC
MTFDLSFVYIILQVIFLEGILSIDNAAILGAMVSVLPKDDKIPWPAALRFLEAPTHRLLGGQRGAALKVGLLGAYLGRGLMLLMASYVIQNSFLKVLGAAYLIKLACEQLGQPEEGEEEESRFQKGAGKGFWSVVIAVELADLAFSLDNVVAVIALSDNLYIVLFGVAMGILTMRFAAGIFTYMIAKEPVLKPAAYLVVFNIGVELLLAEFAGIHIGSVTKFAISAGTIVIAVVYARVKALHVLQPALTWIGQGMGNVNELLDWALVPVIFAFRILFKGIALLLDPMMSRIRPPSRAMDL